MRFSTVAVRLSALLMLAIAAASSPALAAEPSKAGVTDIRTPILGEGAATKATVSHWYRKAGEAVALDEPLVELDTDAVTIEVPAPAAGVLGEIAAKEGDKVVFDQLLGRIKAGAPAKSAAPPKR